MPKPRRRHRAAHSARLNAACRRKGGSPTRVSPPELEAVIEGDRRFFVRHPQRSHRLRLTGLAEIDAASRSGQALADPADGQRWFTVVARIPGGRSRRFVQLPCEIEPDMPEPFCAELYRKLAGLPDTSAETGIVFFGAADV